MKILSVKNVEDIRHRIIPFDGDWYEAFGKPEQSGCWIVYGKSGQGKSRFALMLARKFDEMGYRTLYLTLEMGFCADFQSDIRETGILPAVNKIVFTDECSSIAELDEYLSKQRSPDVIVIDSIQYLERLCGAKSDEIIHLRKKYNNKIFVFISHVDGREVEGKTAYDVKRDSFKRIYIEGFKASYIGRGKGGPLGYFVIWSEGFAKYWLQDIKNEEDNGTTEENSEAD